MSTISSKVQPNPGLKTITPRKSQPHNLTPKNLRLDIPLININCANCIPIKYSNHQYNELLAKMAARHCYSVDRNIPKETRTTHPSIPGITIYSTRSLYNNPYNIEGEAAWKPSGGSPAVIMMKEDQFAQIDLSSAEETLLIGFKHNENNLAVAIKTEKSIILIQFRRHTLSMEAIHKWLERQNIKIEQIIFLSPVDKKHLFQEIPTLTLDPFSKLGDHSDYRSPYIMAGKAGLIFLNNSETTNNFYRWEKAITEEGNRTAEIDKEKCKAEEMLGAVLIDSIEGLLLEYASQTGQGCLTPIKLGQLYESVLQDKSFDFLRYFFIKTYDKKTDKPSNWTALFSLYLAKRAMPVIAPSIVDVDSRITTLRSLYYGCSRLSRFFNRIEAMELNILFDKLLVEAKQKRVLDNADFIFIEKNLNARKMLSYYEGLQDNDVLMVVHWNFPQWSAFPFWMLQNEGINILSIVGGYEYARDDELLRLVIEKGWGSVAIATYLKREKDSSLSEWDGLTDLKASSTLVKKFGAEPVGQVIAIENKNSEDFFRYLLPAITDLIQSRADFNADYPSSLVCKFISVGRQLFLEAPLTVKALPALVRFIKTSEDISPHCEGRLACKLVGLSKAAKKEKFTEDFFEYALPNLAHLITTLDELDPQKKGSLTNMLFTKGAFLSANTRLRERLTWVTIKNLLPHIKSKNELDEFLEKLPSWKDSLENLNHLMSLLGNKPKAFPLPPKETGHLILEVVTAQSPTYSVILRGALASPSISKARYQPIKDFLASKQIDLRLKMNVLADYTELLQMDELFFPDKESLLQNNPFIQPHASQDKEKDKIEKTFGHLAEKINAIIQGIMETPPEKKAKARRLQERISSQMNAFRESFLTNVLGRPITDTEIGFISKSENYEKILRLVALVFTIDRGESFREPLLARVLLTKLLNVFFLNYDPTAADPQAKANAEMNTWLYSLSLEDFKSIAKEAFGQNTERILKDRKCNKEIRAQLMAKGYNNRLWSYGIDFKAHAKEGLNQEEKRGQILSATFELVEIALLAKITQIEGREITLQYADNLDSYQKAKEFADLIIERSFHLTANMKNRLRYILESVREMDRQPILDDLSERIFRITIKKDLFTESFSGVGVPGCFNPRGLHREMPYVHATEANAGLIQIFAPKGNQVANAVVLYMNKGAYVYAGYNGTGYNMDRIFAQALIKLTEFVPAVILTPSSAGFDSLKKFAVRRKMKITKPPAIFSSQYVDYGEVDQLGNITLEEDFYIITKDSFAQLSSDL